jgi:hypothetical protein
MQVNTAIPTRIADCLAALVCLSRTCTSGQIPTELLCITTHGRKPQRRYALAKPNARSSHSQSTLQGASIAVIAATILVTCPALTLYL